MKRKSPKVQDTEKAMRKLEGLDGFLKRVKSAKDSEALAWEMKHLDFFIEQVKELKFLTLQIS